MIGSNFIGMQPMQQVDIVQPGFQSDLLEDLHNQYGFRGNEVSIADVFKFQPQKFQMYDNSKSSSPKNQILSTPPSKTIAFGS